MTPKSRREKPPNFLIIMSDEHGAKFSSAYGHRFVASPAMDRLAREGVTFEAAYCNAPLCVPSRICFMTGRYNWHCEGWDNAVPMRGDALTWPFLLRSRGYDVALSGKMHLVGRDHLHGFNRQLARDIHSQMAHPIYSWRDGIPQAKHPWPGVYEAGQGVPGHEERDAEAGALAGRKTTPTGAGTTLEVEVDDEAELAAVDYLRQRAGTAQPFALCVGFIAPHFPFVVPEPFFSSYWPEKADLPDIPEGHLDNLPAAAARLRQAFGFWGHTEEQVRRARAAYYGLITYMDRKIGNLLDALDKAGPADNTVVIYTSDHGEMLGEHGLWRKMCFYDEAARVPLQIRWPAALPAGRRVQQCASLIDLTATVLDLAGVAPHEQKTRWQVDGDSLLPLMQGSAEAWKDEAFAEYYAHGTDRPRAMLRRGNWKLCCGYGRPVELELYDLDSDPGEFQNMAEDARYQSVRDALLGRLFQLWDGAQVDRKVRHSQQERALIRSAAPEEGLL